jgi:hypothetical protein
VTPSVIVAQLLRIALDNREKRKQNEPFGGDFNPRPPIEPHLWRVPLGLPR